MNKNRRYYNDCAISSFLKTMNFVENMDRSSLYPDVMITSGILSSKHLARGKRGHPHNCMDDDTYITMSRRMDSAYRTMKYTGYIGAADFDGDILPAFTKSANGSVDYDQLSRRYAKKRHDRFNALKREGKL